MKFYKFTALLFFLFFLNSCGKNESKNMGAQSENKKDSTEIDADTLEIDSQADTPSTSNPIPNPILKEALKAPSKNATPDNSKINNDKSIETDKPKAVINQEKPKAEIIFNAPLKNLLNTAQLGKPIAKKELIEHYKFPKEGVDLIKSVTKVGENKLYFKWDSIWFVEKVSDAKFNNDTMKIKFDRDKLHISGGAIGIKYNKKIYTDLILKNRCAYIPTVKGFHWQIGR